MLTEDIENEIPVNNLIFSQGSNELRVKVVKKIANGYKETTIEKLKALSCPEKQICVTKPFQRWQAIANTICCSVEDIKQAVSLQDCWKVYDAKFRRVLLYGKIVVTNHFSRDGRTIYKFAVDDGSGEIFGTMNIKKETKRNLSAQAGRLTAERNKLRRKQEVGINLKGIFYPPESQECKTVLDSIANLHIMINRNIKHQRKSFQLGPMSEKALILASLYRNPADEVQLCIHDISLDDSIELAWKRQLNKLYLKEYLKPPKT